MSHANDPAHPLDNPKYGPVPLEWVFGSRGKYFKLGTAAPTIQPTATHTSVADS